ncbi:MAG: hypothetical protein KAI47_17255 [Deltaproteobacteria bacterium]|nr:hypothetical protein [Deltaproteobacteria bacterium]
MVSSKLKEFSPSRFLLVSFAFVFVFVWLYLFIPMLLGSSNFQEAMAIISSNEDAIFSSMGVLHAVARGWAGVLFALIFGFFFLEIRHVFPLLLVVLAATTFLSKLTLSDVVYVDPESLNSVFVFSQFVAISVPFLLLDRYGKEGFPSWKAFFLQRFSLRERVQRHKESLKPFLIELVVVIVLLFLSRLPMLFMSKGVGHFLGSYFVDMGVVFFYASFVFEIVVFLANDPKSFSPLKDALFMLFIAMIAISVSILFSPLIVSAISFPLFCLFGSCSMQGSIVYSPGLAYFVSFFSLKSFFYSGIPGFVHLLGVLLSLYGITVARLKKLELDDIYHSSSTKVFYALSVAVFGVIVAISAYSGRGRTYLFAQEVFRQTTYATKICSSKKALVLSSGLFKFAKVFDLSKKDKGIRIVLPVRAKGTEKQGKEDASAKMNLNGLNLEISRPAFDDKHVYIEGYLSSFRDDDKRWFVVGYEISLESKSITKSWIAKTRDGVYPVGVVQVDGESLFLFNSKHDLRTLAFDEHGTLRWKNPVLATSDKRLISRDGRVFVALKVSDRRLFGMVNLAMGAIKSTLKPYEIAGYDPETAKYGVVDARTGKTILKDRDVHDIIKADTILAVDVSRWALMRVRGSARWTEKNPADLGLGYFEDAERVYALTKQGLVAVRKRDGTVAWSFPANKNVAQRVSLHMAKSFLYVVRSDIGHEDTTVLLLDRKHGTVCGRWHMESTKVSGSWLDQDGTLYLGLSPIKSEGETMVIGLHFSTTSSRP